MTRANSGDFFLMSRIIHAIMLLAVFFGASGEIAMRLSSSIK
jgi:hypothetical protein